MKHRVLHFQPDPPAGGGTNNDPPKPPEPVVLTDDLRKQIGEEAVTAFKSSLPKVPEKFSVALPDNTYLPPDITDRVSATARELRLTSDADVQKMVALLDSEAKTLVNRIIADHSPGGRVFTEQRQQWEAAVLQAPDLGNNDPRVLQAKTARVNTFVEKYFPQEVREEVLNKLGVGSHPGFFRAILKLADLMKEDGWISGQPTTTQKKSPAERLYGADGLGRNRQGASA